MSANDVVIAENIRAQIGGPAFFMIGAKTFMAVENGLQFRIMQNSKKVTTVIITIDANDTYTLKFYNIRGTNVKMLAEVSGVYVDSLHSVISSHTGLELSMPRVYNARTGARMV